MPLSRRNDRSRLTPGNFGTGAYWKIRGVFSNRLVRSTSAAKTGRSPADAAASDLGQEPGREQAEVELLAVLVPFPIKNVPQLKDVDPLESPVEVPGRVLEKSREKRRAQHGRPARDGVLDVHGSQAAPRRRFLFRVGEAPVDDLVEALAEQGLSDLPETFPLPVDAQVERTDR